MNALSAIERTPLAKANMVSLKRMGEENRTLSFRQLGLNANHSRRQTSLEFEVIKVWRWKGTKWPFESRSPQLCLHPKVLIEKLWVKKLHLLPPRQKIPSRISPGV